MNSFLDSDRLEASIGAWTAANYGRTNFSIENLLMEHLSELPTSSVGHLPKQTARKYWLCWGWSSIPVTHVL